MELHKLIMEETLQASLKRLMKPAGTLKDVMGRDTSVAADLLSDVGYSRTTGKVGPSTEVYVLKGGSPLADQLLKSVSGSRSHSSSGSTDHGELRIVSLPGGTRVLVSDNELVVTTSYQHDRLVEDQGRGEVGVTGGV